VDHAGLSELLKPLPIDSVLLLVKLTKPEYPLKICSLVVDHHADLAPEVTPMVPGDIMLTPESDQVGTTVIIHGVMLIHSPQLEVVDQKHVPDNVILNLEEIGLPMLTLENPVILSPLETLKPCKPKS